MALVLRHRMKAGRAGGEYAPVELRQLRYFVQVARLENFSRAADHLHIAQPALSRHVFKLENELGVKLLHRHGRGAVPTEAGKILLNRSCLILDELDDIFFEISSLAKQPVGNIRVAIPPSISQVMAKQFFENCKTSFPGISLHLVEAWTGHIVDWLLNDKCDLGIIYSTQSDDRLDLHELITEDLFFITSRSGGMAQTTPNISLSGIARQPLIVPTQLNGLRILVDRTFAEAGTSPNIVQEVEVWSVLKEAVTAGTASTLLPLCEIQSEIDQGQLVAIPIEKPGIQRTLCIAHTAENRRRRGLEKIVKLAVGQISHYFA